MYNLSIVYKDQFVFSSIYSSPTYIYEPLIMPILF